MKTLALATSIIVAIAALAGCSSLTPQQQALINAAKPIADAAITAAAASYGVPPGDTQAIISAADSLYGSAVQAQAGQPIAAGASAPAIGSAIAASTPASKPDTQAAILQLAAQLAMKRVK